MAWPLSQEYNEAVQNPKTVFGDPDLREAEAVVGPLGIPMPRSGNFADVYQMKGKDGRLWALKCFTRPATGLRERYREIDAHLNVEKLPFSVGFQFLPEGVRLRGVWYPALKMEWVEGQQLNHFVRDFADRPDDLKAVFTIWLRLCRRLRKARVAHADLQHGNVLLVPGAQANMLRLRLIDYDGMWVPALAGKPSGEVGHPSYQHPQRLRDQVYSADADRFPHLVIACALRAVAIGGRALWDRFDNGDNLLFREVDFADPQSSILMKELWWLDDEIVTDLLSLMLISLHRPLHETPWLDEVRDEQQPERVHHSVIDQAADMIGVARPRRQVVASAPLSPAEEDYADDSPEMVRQRRQSPLVWVAAAVLAAIVTGGLLVGVVALFGKSTAVVGPAPAGGPTGTTFLSKAADPNAMETQWVDIAPGPAIAEPSLVDGIDVAPPDSKVIRSFPSLGKDVREAWFAPDGRRAIITRPNGFGRLDLHTGEYTAIGVWPVAPKAAVLSADARWLVAVTPTNSVEVYSVESGRRTHTLAATATPAVAITPDGRRFAVSEPGVGYREFALETGAELRRHGSLQAQAFHFTADGRHAVAATESGVERWSLADGTATTLRPLIAATKLAVGSGGLAVAANDIDLLAWTINAGEPQLAVTPPGGRPVGSLAATADGTLLVGWDNGQVTLLGADETTSLMTAAKPGHGRVRSITPTGDGQHALVVTEDEGLTLRRVADLVRAVGPSKFGPTVGCLEFFRSGRIPAAMTRFASDPTGSHFVVASPERVLIHDAGTFAIKHNTSLAGGGIVAVGLGSEDQVIACQEVGASFVTRAWDLKANMGGPAFLVGNDSPGRVTRIIAVRDKPWVLATTEVAGDLLFDTTTASVVPGWPIDRDGKTTAAMSPDGKQAALVSPAGPVRMWSTATSRVGRTCEASHGVTALAFTPDGDQLVGAYPLGRLRVWDADAGTVVRDIDPGLRGPITSIEPLSATVALVHTARGRTLVHLESGKLLSTGDGPDPLVGRGFAVPTRGWAMAIDMDGRLTAWRVDGRLAASLHAKPTDVEATSNVLTRDGTPLAVTGLTFHDDDKEILIAAADGTIARHDAKTLALKTVVPADESPIKAMASAGGRVFTLGMKDKVTVHDGRSLAYLADIESGILAVGKPALFSVHPTGRHFLTAADKVRVIEVSSEVEVKATLVPKEAIGKPLTQFAFSADGETGVGRWGNAVLAVWHPLQPTTPRVLLNAAKASPAGPDSMAVSREGKTVAVGSEDGGLKAWSTADGKTLFDVQAHPTEEGKDAILGVWSMPGDRFLTLGRDGRIVIWTLDGKPSGEPVKVPAGNWRATVSIDGTTMVLHQPGKMVRVTLPGKK